MTLWSPNSPIFGWGLFLLLDGTEKNEIQDILTGMSFIQKNLWWVLVLGLIGYFVYSSTKTPCDIPISYKIGTVDPRFGVTQAQFQADILEASDVWSKAINKTLFKYDPNGSLTINLVYDARQLITQKEHVLHTNIAQTTQTADSIKQQFTSLKNAYSIAQQEYTDQLAQFNQAQDTYNTQVSYWNSRGGAPQAEYQKLTAQKNELAVERAVLEQKRLHVNQLSDEINAFIDKYNLLIDHINSDVHTINNDGLAGTQFEEGVYMSDSSGRRIIIYQFSNRTDLIRVLAHELGHSLQLAHNANPNSIMNPVNQGTTLTLSLDDLQELKTECGLK